MGFGARQRYRVADTIWEIETESPEIFQCAAKSFPHGIANEDEPVDFRVRVVLDDRLHGRVETAPRFRGRDHLVFAQYGEAGFFAVDMRRRTCFIAVSSELAHDAIYWRECIFPVLLGLMCLVLDAVPLHTACFEDDGRGILVAGRSGAGKSTLIATLARMGFTYLSDDWVYLSGRTGRVHAAPVNMKLLPEAIDNFFPELASRRPSVAMNGELSVSFDPAEAFSVPRAFSCRPDVVILLDRKPGAETTVRKASLDDLVGFFSEPLDCVPACFESSRNHQIEMVKGLAEQQCCVLTCWGTPEAIAETVLQVSRGAVSSEPEQPATFPVEPPLDLLRRHAATPQRCRAEVGDTVISVASDSVECLRLLPSASTGHEPAIHLDLILEPARGPVLSLAFAHENLVGVTFGGGGCLLLDVESRSGMAFVDSEVLENGTFVNYLSRMIQQSGFGKAASGATALTVGATG